MVHAVPWLGSLCCVPEYEIYLGISPARDISLKWMTPKCQVNPKEMCRGSLQWTSMLSRGNNCYDFVLWVVDSSQSKQNAGFLERQQGYLFQTDIVNSTQNSTTSTRLDCKLQFDLRHTCFNTASAKYTRPLSHFNKHGLRKIYTRPLSHLSKHVRTSSLLKTSPKS